MKTYKWRIYADNNIEREIVDHLRDSGMDVLWVAENAELKCQTDDSFHYQKARELKRYLLTHDDDFWDEQKFSLNASPGLIILATKDLETAKHLPRLLQKLLQDYNPLPDPLYLDQIKIKLSNESITIKMVDRDTQKKTSETWLWSELYYPFASMILLISGVETRDVKGREKHEIIAPKRFPFGFDTDRRRYAATRPGSPAEGLGDPAIRGEQ